MEPKWNQSGTTQVERFGVGIFWRNVILERTIFPTSYEPKVQVVGRGGEI